MAKRLWAAVVAVMIVMMCGLSFAAKDAKDVKTAPAPAPVPAKASEPIKIGAIFAVTGPAANLAPRKKKPPGCLSTKSMRKAASRREALLIIKDSQGSPEKAVSLPNS